jgi:hypothetical protein
MSANRFFRARVLSAAALLLGAMAGSLARADEPSDPIPTPDQAPRTLSILEARAEGAIEVEARGQGEDKVGLRIRNLTPRRLNVVIPPGLVASSAAGQGGGAFQSMGLGTPTNREGSFGQFRASNRGAGFRSVGLEESVVDGVAVSGGQSVDLVLPAVCLNYGWATPTAKDQFELVDVKSYTTDLRTQVALRSLATHGTSLGIAQATMWNVCNGLGFDRMAQLAGKRINPRELAVAARFVETLNRTGSTDVVDPAYLTEGRLFVKVTGEGALKETAERLARSFEGTFVMGMPVRVVADDEAPTALAPALFLTISLTGEEKGSTLGRVTVMGATPAGDWRSGGSLKWQAASEASYLDGAIVGTAVEHSIVTEFVKVKPVRREKNSMTLRVENRLPFTVSNLVVRASGTDSVRLEGMGVGPGRSAEFRLQATSATVDRVELNGL